MVSSNHRWATLAAILCAVSLAACTSSSGGSTPPATASPQATSPQPVPTDSGNEPGTAPKVTLGDAVANELAVPWGIAFLPDGDALVAERDSGRILRISPSGRVRVIGTVPGVAHGGEGGLLGLAIDPARPRYVYAYLTSVLGDNRVVRMTYSGAVGPARTILTGIPSAGIHNGGRIIFGPDGDLYIGTGEAGQRTPAQDKDSLGGKILRVEPSGKVPSDNPFPGSPVWSLGHRNVQGLAFDSSGQLWATEFGQDTWDELNKIQPGANYGWPVVEGMADKKPYVDPFVVWKPADASPSGLAIVDDVAYVASLRGKRLWQVPLVGAGRRRSSRLLYRSARPAADSDSNAGWRALAHDVQPRRARTSRARRRPDPALATDRSMSAEDV